MDRLNKPSFERALCGFQSIMDFWNVPRKEGRVILGLFFYEDPWRKLGALSPARQREIQDRMSLVGGIYRVLREMHPQEDQAREWLNTALAYLDEETPLNVMLSNGEDGMRSILKCLNLPQNFQLQQSAQQHRHS